MLSSNLTTAQVLSVFTEKIVARTGTITDSFDDGQRLLTRSVLPLVAEARPGDKMQGGIALKATSEGIWLYPYIFRLVCRNGAIVASTLESRFIVDLEAQDEESVLQLVREGVEACCAPEVFTENMRNIRTSAEVQADVVLNMMPLLSRFPRHGRSELISQILDRFTRGKDQSRFGLANAITSLARDTRDAELRWNLEELGGGIAVGKVPSSPKDGRRGAAARSNRLVSVG
jgi:hypothetical protein